ncbi:WD40-repeat-containing domain protein [Radiomyces spectabilis]|uniref:WD40-repeat-containing domain protein n=1 Tax=Radiomyces spectabilis TaxID=64574 RepID=UPI00221FCFFA|nr:WD40-repeat-containing domain protein [Radiomyces spectabilis]KAI8384971.1 WD40-repeat-containing domain protein [Radiomyces spectabilis]
MDVDTGDNSGTETSKRKTRRKPAAKKAAPSKPDTKLVQTKLDKGKKVKKIEFDPAYVKQLAADYPDSYWTHHADTEYHMIDAINEDNHVEAVACNISDQAPITSMALSTDGTLLATFSNIGACKIWDIENDFKLVRKLRDSEEANIDEFYCGKFVSETQELMVVGGKLKDRHRWSAEDEDNHILPCPIKIFNLETCTVIAKLEGHTEEILCIKTVKFKGENYYISTSQDGYIRKWHMASDWTTLLDSSNMEDGVTCMAFTVSFVPNTGNKYFLAACDEHLRLYDFEDNMLLQTFEDMYSSYCDCGKFIRWLDEDAYMQQQNETVKKEEDNETQVDKMDQDSKQDYAWFISRGAEMCDVSDGVSSKPNTCTLHKLIYPKETGGKFELEETKRFSHEDYHANSWLVKITSNGRYILAPTIYGQIFVFNILTGHLTAILKDHEDIEVRDVVFHPYRPLIFSCGDDGFVKVYTYKNTEDDHIEKDLDVGMTDQ